MSKQYALVSAETTIAASGSFTFSPANLPNCDLHRITFVSGSGTAKIEVNARTKGSADASAVSTLATGLTAPSYDTYVYKGANDIIITETGTSNSINVIIESYA